MKSGYRRFDTVLLKVVRVVTGLLLMIMFVVIALAVVFRYVLNSPPFWTEEFARYAMFYMVLIGSAAAIRQERHPSLTFVVQKLPAGFRKKWNFLLDALVFLVLVVVFWQGIVMATDEWTGKTAALRISFFWVYLALPIGSFLMMIQLVTKHVLGSKTFNENARHSSISGEE